MHRSCAHRALGSSDLPPAPCPSPSVARGPHFLYFLFCAPEQLPTAETGARIHSHRYNTRERTSCPFAIPSRVPASCPARHHRPQNHRNHPNARPARQLAPDPPRFSIARPSLRSPTYKRCAQSRAKTYSAACFPRPPSKQGIPPGAAAAAAPCQRATLAFPWKKKKQKIKKRRGG
ncbi:hypothetical protein BDY21DRAFT_359040 [Lineolata rhizophorae]|uniref:Uncharacterized protein n=1 Tax=Lineolata rhizophorae TaxID=578093 RepID=A0A6A6NM09_9PEZI|nr:hypothetical protein BDY21DRAFT_359040 [Lineolata rhizophorae]